MATNTQFSDITKSHKINDFLSVKLENGRTEIYVMNERFMQCKFLLLNIAKETIKDYDNISSIDEAADVYDRSLEFPDKNNISISPEEEFRGHCSNLEAWAQYDYDTRLLHSNLAFPLLRKLTELGDPIAQRVFKEEIVRRYKSGYTNTIIYLTKRGYLNYLSPEEFELLIDDVEFEIIDELIMLFEDCDLHDDIYLDDDNKKQLKPLVIKLIDISKFKYGIAFLRFLFCKISPLIRKEFVEHFLLILKKNDKPYYNHLLNQPSLLFDNDTLELLDYVRHEEKIIGVMLNKTLDLSTGEFSDYYHRTFFNSFIYFSDIQDIQMIDGLDELVTLKHLNLSGHSITTIAGLDNLNHLEYLDLSNNSIKNIANLKTLTNLKYLNLNNNQIDTLSDLEGLNNLKELYLGGNQIKGNLCLPKLPNLKVLHLERNLIQGIRELDNLPSLECLILNQNEIANLNEVKLTPGKQSKRDLFIKHLEIDENKLISLSGLPQFGIHLKSISFNDNSLSDLSLFTNLLNLTHISLAGNKIYDFSAFQGLSNLQSLNLSRNNNLKLVPNYLSELKSLQSLYLAHCPIEKYENRVRHFIWRHKNYKYYQNYTPKDIEEYENEHGNNAVYRNKTNKPFVEWLLKKERLSELLEDNKCTISDLHLFEKETSKHAFYGGRLTKGFLKWLEQRNRKKINHKMTKQQSILPYLS